MINRVFAEVSTGCLQRLRPGFCWEVARTSAAVFSKPGGLPRAFDPVQEELLAAKYRSQELTS